MTQKDSQTWQMEQPGYCTRVLRSEVRATLSLGAAGSEI